MLSCFIAMELLEGLTLATKIGRRPLDLETFLHLALQIADALEAAHKRAIVHRDLKPLNIFVTSRGDAKLLDFGLAKRLHFQGAALTETAGLGDSLTLKGQIVGTIAYMSPEQLQHKDVDARSDLFSLGAVLYEMATGKEAFSGPTWAVTVHAILGQAPVSLNESVPGLPQRLQEIIDKCLIKNRDLRYQSAADVHRDLLQLKKDYESGKSLKSVRVATTWSLKRKLRLAAAAAVVLVLAASVVWGPRVLRRLAPPASRAGNRALSCCSERASPFYPSRRSRVIPR